MYILYEDALVASESCVDKGHGDGKPVTDQVFFAVRPVEFKVIHSGATGGEMRGVIGG